MAGLLWKTWIAWITFGVIAAEQRFANQPSPQTAVIGTTVVLPCRIINKVGVLQWTRDGFGLGNERELVAFKRYKMIGSDDEGDYSLQISPVTLEDDAEFQCQVTGWKDVMGVRSKTAKLTVYVPPEPPEIIQGTVVKATAGQGVQLDCVSRGGKPAADIQWLDGLARVAVEGVSYSRELLEDGHRRDAKSTWTFLARRAHHLASFTCVASNPALPQPQRAQVRLEVRYPPEITIRHDKDGYKEGESATLICSAEANPSHMTFRWYRGNQLVSDSNSTHLVIKNVRKAANLEDVTCEASNEIGMSRKITRLSVHYAPSFRVPPTDYYAQLKENITLRCEVDSIPPPKIVWLGGHAKSEVEGRGPVLKLRVTEDTVGSYTCIAKAEGFPEISGTMSVILKGPPQVTAERVQWGHPGTRVRLQCQVHSSPPGTVSVYWTHNGRQLQLEPGRYDIEEEATSDGGIRYTLLIHSAKPEDFGSYNCSVQNSFGSEVLEIVLSRKKTLPLLLIMCIAVGGIFFILLIVLLIIFCARKTTTKQQETKSQGLAEKALAGMQMNDQNSTANESDLKVEPDNRTGSSLSNKEDGELEHWDRDLSESQHSPNFMSSSKSYMYPTESLISRGHKMVGDRLSSSYGNYVSHAKLNGSANTNSYINLGSGVLGPIVTSSQRSLFMAYGDTDTADGLKGFRPVVANSGFSGYSNHNFQNSTLPLSLQLPSRESANSPNSVGVPKLGIPVDPSQYIVPPRTQLLQGALATHV